MSVANQTGRTFKSERLIAFTDAVMAVAITLLVLDLKLPEGLSEAQLPSALSGLWHSFWCYALSFVVIGLLWMAHNTQFTHIRRVDGALLWLNLFFLMTVALIPFVTSVLSDSGGVLPTALYAGVLMTSSLCMTAMWWHASRDEELMPCDVPASTRRVGLINPLLVSAVFAASIGVAHVVGSAAGQWTWLLAAAAGPVAHRLSRP